MMFCNLKVFATSELVRPCHETINTIALIFYFSCLVSNHIQQYLERERANLFKGSSHAIFRRILGSGIWSHSHMGTAEELLGVIMTRNYRLL
jgi:hypothetical protein